MGREIVTEEDIRKYRQREQAARARTSFGVAPGVAAAPAPVPQEGGEPKADTYQGRLLKLIPTEVVAMYVFLDGVLRSAPAGVPAPALRWLVFTALLCATWLYLNRVEKVSKKHQLALSTVAFAVWVFSLGGPFVAFRWYSPIYGALLLPLYTFGVAIDQGKKPEDSKKNGDQRAQ